MKQGDLDLAFLRAVGFQNRRCVLYEPPYYWWIEWVQLNLN